MMEIRIKPTKCLFKNEDDFFYIWGAEVNPEDMYSKDVELNKYGNISFKGTMPKLNANEEYTVVLKKDTQSTYKGSYILENIKQDKPVTVSEQRAFLETILTPTQVNNIYDVYGEEQDIVGMIEKGEFDYSNVKGIADKTFEKLRNKVMDNVDMSEVLAFLSKYGIKYNMISKLVKEYKNPTIVIQKIEENPYLLTEIKGIGFKKADEIAKAVGYSMTSGHRIESCLRYCIGEENQSGHSWVEYKQLLNKSIDLLNINKSYVENILANGAKDIVNADGKYTTRQVYESEKYVAMKMTQYKTQSKNVFEKEELDTFLDEYCEKNNVELEENQRKFFHDWNENSILMLIGGGGCVDKDTEFFNGKQWKKISEYEETDGVLQYNNDGTTSIVSPLEYHKLLSNKLTLVKNETGSINQCLSDEHNFVYETSRGNIAIKEFSEIKEIHNSSKLGFYGKVKTAFDYNGTGINLSDNEIRLMVAVIADGNFPNIYGEKCRINLKKDRKKNRLELLLKDTNTIYTKSDKNDGFSVYTFDAPRREKEYTDKWYNCTNKQLKVVADEVMNWDGSVSDGRAGQFWTNVKSSADFIQFAFSATGNRATMSIRNRDNGDIEYYVTVSKNNKVSMKTKEGSPKLEFQEYNTIDGYKYCFTLPSGMWLMRREGRIAVTGNCGKSWIQRILLELIDTKKLRTALLSPTGKASKVQSNYTGRQASTIHRKAGVFGDDVEGNKEINEDVIIVDESSMCDIFILAKLFKAITNNNARILFVGDDFQLPSVGVGNFLYDIIHSAVVKVSVLKKVFRQADGGILDVATKVREGKTFLNDTADGRIVFGKDCVFILAEQQYIRDGVIANYKKVIKRFDQDDVVILTPTNKGKLGTIELNKEIQKIANPPSATKKEKAVGSKDNPTIFRVGDAVMNVVNTYDIDTVEGGVADIFNGDTGKIIDIDDDKKAFIVEIDGIQVVMKFGTILTNLVHSWVTTIHKSQGSQYKVVIVIADKSMTYQLNANLLYTGFSRAKDYMLVLGQAQTINRAIKKFANMERRSFLQGLLDKLNNDKGEVVEVENDKDNLDFDLEDYTA